MHGHCDPFGIPWEGCDDASSADCGKTAMPVYLVIQLNSYSSGALMDVRSAILRKRSGSFIR